MARPRLIVFDLDYTLWPFWVDTHHDPPFVKRCDGQVYDRHGQVVSFYPDVPRVLQRLHSEGYMLAVASRSSTPPEANELCHLFDWDRYFTYKEIYPGSKVQHFGRFAMASGIPYEDMLFFDDEQRNIIELRSIGLAGLLGELRGKREVRHSDRERLIGLDLQSKDLYCYYLTEEIRFQTTWIHPVRGVTSILVSDGVTESLIKEGLETFQLNRQQHR